MWRRSLHAQRSCCHPRAVDGARYAYHEHVGPDLVASAQKMTLGINPAPPFLRLFQCIIQRVNSRGEGMIRVERLLFAASVTLVASTAHAQSSTTETAPTPAPMSILAARRTPARRSTPSTPRGTDCRSGRDETSRTAVSAFATSVLRNSLIEGLTDPGTLASRVEAANAANDDKAISAIWVRYVQSLKAPVRGMNYGDQALALKAPPRPPFWGSLRAVPRRPCPANVGREPLLLGTARSRRGKVPQLTPTSGQHWTGCGPYRLKAAPSSSMWPMPS